MYSGYIVYTMVYIQRHIQKKDKETMLSANRDPIVLYPGLFYADLIQCDDSCVDPEKQAGMLYSCITIIEYEYPVHSIYALIPRPSYGKFDAVRSTTNAIISIIHAYTYKVQSMKTGQDVK